MDAAPPGAERLRKQVLVAARENDALRPDSPVRVLLAAAQKTVSKDALHAAVFADEHTGLDAVEVLIHRLRKKLESPTQPGVVIATFRGLGYMLTLAKPA